MTRPFWTLFGLLAAGVLASCTRDRAILEVELVPRERMVDATFLRDRFGELGAVVRGHASLRIPMSVGALDGSVGAPAISGSIVVSGDVLGEDEQGRVRTSYRRSAVVTIDDHPLPSSGACTPGTP